MTSRGKYKEWETNPGSSVVAVDLDNLSWGCGVGKGGAGRGAKRRIRSRVWPRGFSQTGLEGVIMPVL